MPTYEFIWTPRARQKLTDNFVTPEEYERVVRKAKKIEVSRSSGRPCCRGRIGSKVLFCVFEDIDGWRIKPINAFWIAED
jgi:hypothetical protein